MLFDLGLNYSALNTARCAISSFVQQDNDKSIGTHHLIKRFFKSVFELRPCFPRYQNIWNVEPVLKFLKNLSPTATLPLKDLTLKLVMLIALITGQRSQSIHLLDLNDMSVRDNCAIFTLSLPVKQSKVYKKQPIVALPAYSDMDLCVFTCLREYLVRTRSLRNTSRSSMCTKLFISIVKPHRAVTKCTISRWIKCVMVKSGINTDIFKPHSTRSASTSKASFARIPLDIIMEKAGWTKESTFAKYYNKPVINNTQDTYSNAVLHML